MGPRGDHGPGPQGPWAQKNKEIIKLCVFLKMEKTVRLFDNDILLFDGNTRAGA